MYTVWLTTVVFFPIGCGSQQLGITCTDLTVPLTSLPGKANCNDSMLVGPPKVITPSMDPSWPLTKVPNRCQLARRTHLTSLDVSSSGPDWQIGTGPKSGALHPHLGKLAESQHIAFCKLFAFQSLCT